MTDTIVRGLLRDPPVRVIAVASTEVAREAARRHQSVGGAQVALGRAAACGLLLATLTKSGEQVTLQFMGDGSLGGILADAYDGGKVRVSVKNPSALLPGPHGQRVSVAEGVGRSGVVRVIRDMGKNFQTSGQSTLLSGEIDEDVEHYLRTSEQIESAMGCEVLLGSSEVTAAAGVLVQCMPDGDATALVAQVRSKLSGGALLELLRAHEADLASASEADSAALLVSLVRSLLGEHGADFEHLDSRPVSFHCPCSKDRVMTSLSMLEPEALEEMLREDRGAEVTCNFCREVYQVSESELAELVAQRSSRSPS
ncbi:Hsp33 family molecular chaperone HslO [Haliangium ochraceum]|uniref:Hsp33 protein n=1 Tax=Haliangium ochraceum (strain DSM 14365 / JCM 11303 / SMP-2) TaxID=502025 RepID=D0LGQ2_HALO1|nr:Hsp33 family molecular chaperone HslO [Haliangium ochraceum]ACY12798.1 Hsp33 protein [Haliangium ochraceum DSM 14365]